MYYMWIDGGWRRVHNCSARIELDPDPRPPCKRYREELARWRGRKEELDVPKLQRALSIELVRHMAIENGEMEGLYRLHAPAKEWLIANGLERAERIHQIDPKQHERKALRLLLDDQQQAVHEMIKHATGERGLDADALKAWHAHATRHQRHDLFAGMSLPYRGQGRFRRAHQSVLSVNTYDHYVVRGEWGWRVNKGIDRLCEELNRHLEDRTISTSAIAAWAQLEFIRLHPFTDGNSRTSRLLSAWIHARRGEHPPVIRARTRKAYHRRCYPSHEHQQGDQKGLARLLERASVSAMLLDERMDREREAGRPPMHYQTNWDPEHDHYRLEVLIGGVPREVGQAPDVPAAGAFWATWTGEGPSVAEGITRQIQASMDRKIEQARGLGR